MKEQMLSSFKDMKFGMFIHWGLYAVAGGRWRGQTTEYIGEWLQARFRIPNAEYSTLAAQFNPVRFDAELWVKRAAEAGMKYLVFTAKHHEGFAMYHSKCNSFNIVDATPFGRDPLRELAAACRKYDIKLGLYYSQYLDWHEFHAGDPLNASPNVGGIPWGNNWDFPDAGQKNFDLYFQGKVIPQLTELLTGYGEIFLLWFDCPLDIGSVYCRKIRELVHSLQPDCLINGRIGHGCEDYYSLGDNQSMHQTSIRVVEAPGTMNDTWGFKYDDHNWKQPELLIRPLAALAEKDANYLLNIGPMPDGEFPPESVNILAEIAKWYKENGSAIHASSGSPFPQEFDFAYCTVTGNKLHFFLKKSCREITVSGIANKVIGCNVPYRQDGNIIRLYPPECPGQILPRITLELDSPPRVDQRLSPQNGILTLPPRAARLIHGDAASSGANTVRFAEDGTRLAAEPHSTLSPNGALTRWHNPDDRAEWEIYFAESGAYTIFCTTQQRLHSEPWHGGREVELAWDNTGLRKTLSPDIPIANNYYAAAESKLGQITVNTGDCGVLSLRTAALSNPDAVNMDLVNLKLVKENL